MQSKIENNSVSLDLSLDANQDDVTIGASKQTAPQTGNETMAFTQKVIAEKTLATIKRAAIERVYEDGNVKYGIATCRKGGKWVIEMTMQSRSQVMRSIKHHEEMDGVLVWCG